MEGELDRFDFGYARLLGRTVEEMRDSISNPEYLQQRAYQVVLNAEAELAAEEAKKGMSSR